MSTLEVDVAAISADGIDTAEVTLTLLDENGAPATSSHLQVVAIATGRYHVCAISFEATVVCWGSNWDAQLGYPSEDLFMPASQVPGLTDVTAISAGSWHTCALTASGLVWCWGGNWAGQLGDGTTDARTSPVQVPGLTGVTDISVGDGHTCARKTDGTVECWGMNDAYQLGDAAAGFHRPSPGPVPGVEDVVAVSAGGRHTCALLADRTIECWGANWGGQLGRGTNGASLADPGQVTGITDAAGLAAGDFHTCAVLVDQSVRCWGRNEGGQLGDGTSINRNAPVPVQALSGVTNVSTGEAHSCALVTDGTIWCWGSNFWGQLGDGTTEPRASPVQVEQMTGATTVEAYGMQTCVLSNEATVHCWGSNVGGIFGLAAAGGQATPVEILTSQGVDDMALGMWHTCIVLVDATMECWGGNFEGQLGNGTISIAVPEHVEVAGSQDVEATDAGGAHTCSVLTNGSVRCWGWNGLGQLGDGTIVQEPVGPVWADGVSQAIDVSLGDVHTCALLDNGTVRCWGHHGDGQLGNGEPTTQFMPYPGYVEGMADAAAIASGWYHTCALHEGGTISCWGDNDFGQLGDGSFNRRLAPSPVVGITDAVAISAGGVHTCALLADSSISCWGYNHAGRLGIPNIGLTNEPMSVPGITTAAGIAVGDFHTCARFQDGSVKCWGMNRDGQLGTGSHEPEDSYTPLAVTTITDAVALEAGSRHTCALTASNALYCWGSDWAGQLGDGTTTGMRRTPSPPIPMPPSVTMEADFGELGVPVDQGDGKFTATFTCDEPGTATITATIGGAAVADDATIQCEATNSPPTAMQTIHTTSQDTSLYVPLAATDIEQDPIDLEYTFAGVTSQGGTATPAPLPPDAPAGSFFQVFYEPPPGVCGITDTISFTVTDAGDLQDQGETRVFIQCPPEEIVTPTPTPAPRYEPLPPVLDPPLGPGRIEAEPGSLVSIYVDPPYDAPAGSYLTYTGSAGGALAEAEWSPSQGRLVYRAPSPELGQTLVQEVEFRLNLDGRSSEPLIVEVVTHQANAPPTARASIEPTRVAPGERVVLDASMSHDPESQGLSFQWQQVSGPRARLLEGNTSNASFAAPDVSPGAQETLVFSVLVSDGALRARSNEVTVHVVGPPPAVQPVETPPAFEAIPQADGVILFRADGNESASYTWDFGDGQTGEGREITHRFTDSGEFRVQVTRGDATATRDVAVHAPAAEVDEGASSAWLVGAGALVVVLLVASLIVLALRRRVQ